MFSSVDFYFWLCFHYLVSKRLPRKVNLRCAQSGEKELRPPGVTSFLSSSRGLSRFVTSYWRVSQPKCVMTHLIAGAGRCIQVACWGRYRGLKSIKTCERKQINLLSCENSPEWSFENGEYVIVWTHSGKRWSLYAPINLKKLCGHCLKQ